ncbi:unnamed protein product, partial [Prorocentrum cordatum]
GILLLPPSSAGTARSRLRSLFQLPTFGLATRLRAAAKDTRQRGRATEATVPRRNLNSNRALTSPRRDTSYDGEEEGEEEEEEEEEEEQHLTSVGLWGPSPGPDDSGRRAGPRERAPVRQQTTTSAVGQQRALRTARTTNRRPLAGNHTQRARQHPDAGGGRVRPGWA